MERFLEEVRQDIMFDEGVNLVTYNHSILGECIGASHSVISNNINKELGRNVTASGITEEEINLLLNKDINNILASFKKTIQPVYENLDDDRKIALINLNHLITYQQFNIYYKNALIPLANGQFTRAVVLMESHPWTKKYIQISYRLRKCLHILDNGKLLPWFE